MPRGSQAGDVCFNRFGENTRKHYQGFVKQKLG
mgnify:CR=1 FL=1